MVKQGDLVKILSGKDAGKTGRVEKVVVKDDRVVVNGVNIVKKHQKPTKANTRAGIIDKPMPIHISNIMVVCPHCNRPTRGAKKEVEGRNVRICKKCGELVDTKTTEENK